MANGLKAVNHCVQLKRNVLRQSSAAQSFQGSDPAPPFFWQCQDFENMVLFGLVWTTGYGSTPPLHNALLLRRKHSSHMRWGPIFLKMVPDFEWNGDLMGTFASRTGDPKSVFWWINWNKLIPWNKDENNYSQNVAANSSIHLTFSDKLAWDWYKWVFYHK